MSDQEKKTTPFVESPLQHLSDHELSRRIAGVVVHTGNDEPWEYVVGRGEVKEIWQHAPAIAGEVWYVDVLFEDGFVRRRFSPISIDYAPVKISEVVVDLGNQAR